jgi:repressor LexA
MANRLREFRERKGLSRKALAALAGTGPTQLNKLESGERRLSDHWAQRLAIHLEVEPYEMFMEANELPPVRWVPVIGEVSCGNWEEAVEHAEGHVPTTSGGPRVFALRPKGDSMDLLIPEEGYALVDPDQVDLIDAKIYVVSNGRNETTAKRYRASPARLVPCSTNPTHHEIVIGSHPFTVVGRVIEVVIPV